MMVYTRRPPPATLRTGTLSRNRVEEVVFVPRDRLVLDPSVEGWDEPQPAPEEKGK